MRRVTPVIKGVEQVWITESSNFLLHEGDFYMIPPEIKYTVQAVNNLTYFSFHFYIDESDIKFQLLVANLKDGLKDPPLMFRKTHTSNI